MIASAITTARRTSGRLRRDREGATAIEFAMALPALIVVILGAMQLGLAFLANAGLYNGVEVAARYAGVFPYPSDDAIRAKARANAFGVNPTLLPAATVTHGTTSGVNYTDVKMTYPYTFNLVFITTPPLNLSYTRRAYQQ